MPLIQIASSLFTLQRSLFGDDILTVMRQSVIEKGRGPSPPICLCEFLSDV